MNKHTDSIGWIIFGIFFGTFVSSWIYFLIVGIIGLSFMIYVKHIENKHDASRGQDE